MHKNKRTILIFLFLTLVVILALYSQSLKFSWKFFDEEMIYYETLLPISKSLSELFEIIKSFGLNNIQEAANPFYSDISNYRGTPVTTLTGLTLFFVLKDKAFNYHLFMLLFHLINSVLVFFIIYRSFLYHTNFPRIKAGDAGREGSSTSCVAASDGGLPEGGRTRAVKHPQFLSHLLVSILTLIWACHPVNIESVLFATNFGALITYFFCFLFLLIFIAKDPSSKFPLYLLVFFFVIYLFPLFLNEYSITLALVLFALSIAYSVFFNPELTLLKAFKNSIRNTFPFFLAFLVYALYYTFSQTIKVHTETSFIVTIERIFWLAPQIFTHLVKLLFFPLSLTIDQVGKVKLAISILEPYAVLCFLFMYLLIAISLVSLFFLKRKSCFLFFMLFVPSFLSLIPFCHIISPVYNLASERYLYFPSFLFILGLSHLISFTSNKKSNYSILLPFSLLCFILLALLIRSYTRIQDWENSKTLLLSSIKTTNSYLLKALRSQMLVRAVKNLEGETNPEKYKEYASDAVSYANKAINEFKSRKIKFRNLQVPKILKYYGLDPETQGAKSAFLLGITELDNTGDVKKVLQIVKPYVKNIKILDPQLLSFYYRVLFNTKNYDEAEKLLYDTLKTGKISPTLLVALSDFVEFKYKDYKQTEKFLLLSFKYFPYEQNTLFGLRRLYGKIINNNERFAYFSFLFGLRTHSKASLIESATVYLSLGKKEEAKKVLKNLIESYQIDHEILELTKGYELKYGRLVN